MMSLGNGVDAASSHYVKKAFYDALHDKVHLPVGVFHIALVVLGFYISYVLISGLFLCPLGHVPGPFVTRFGEWYYQYSLMTGTVTTDLIALHDRYGPVVRLSPTLVDAQLPDVIRDGWKGHNPNKMVWDKDPYFRSIARMGMKVDNLVSIPGLRDAMRMRRLMGAPFARKFLLDQEYIFKSSIKKSIENIDRIASANDGVVDIHRSNKLYAFDVITELAFGGFFKGEPLDGSQSATDLMEQIMLPNLVDLYLPTIFKVLYAIPWKMFDWIRTRELLMKICEQSIDDYQRNVIPGSRKDTLSSVIQPRDENGVGLSHEELVGAAFVVMFGGVDTTAVSLTYLMYQLAKNPQYIDKITDELSVYSNIDSLKPKELEKLPYLNAVIRESLRVNPPYPSPLGRVCPKEGRTLNGHFIPGGIIVSRAAGPSCLDPKVFSEPEKFKPERWFGLSPAKEAQMWEQNMLFSEGPRICLGKDLALLEIRLLISAIILKYELWTGVPDEPGKWDEEMKPFESVVINPLKHQCVIKLKPRNEEFH